MTEQEVFEKLVPLIREVTGSPLESIRMESLLMDDLGADSLDLLDLSFLIESEYGVALQGDEFQREATTRIPGGVYESEGILTDGALEELKNALPEVDPDKLVPGLRSLELPRLLNVAVFVHLIQRTMDQPPPETHPDE